MKQLAGNQCSWKARWGLDVCCVKKPQTFRKKEMKSVRKVRRLKRKESWKVKKKCEHRCVKWCRETQTQTQRHTEILEGEAVSSFGHSEFYRATPVYSYHLSKPQDKTRQKENKPTYSPNETHMRLMLCCNYRSGRAVFWIIIMPDHNPTSWFMGSWQRQCACVADSSCCSQIA